MADDPATSRTLDIDRFIDQAEISGYQRITLPGGRVIPGADRSPAADLVYPADLTGKAVLDVGCFYGFFLHDAIRRGARRAVGIEADPDRFRIASTLAPLWDGKVEVYEGLLEDVTLNEEFDVVLFLNVMHHVKDPVAVMRKLASLCRGTLIVEFRQPHDPQFVQEGLHGPIAPTKGRAPLARRLARRARAAIEAPIMELVTKRLPIIGVGSVEYHRSYFFSQAGFRNMFLTHNRLFRDVEFRRSLTRGQALAFCDCSK
jgi:SAM-dependent methyltransferase